MRQFRADPERAIAAVAADQHGVVSVAQLHAAGMGPDRIKRRVKSGRFHRLHRGVYAVGHPGISEYGRWLAAVLACGDGAVLSHRSAASLWQLLSARPNSMVEVSIPYESGRKTRRGIRIYRRPGLTPEEVTRRHGIPATRPTRTVVDLREVASNKEVRQALRKSEVLGLPIEHIGPSKPEGTRSELEYYFLLLCKQNQIPTPAVNVRVGSLIVDFIWERQRLIVETDGYRFHRGRHAFEKRSLA